MIFRFHSGLWPYWVWENVFPSTLSNCTLRMCSSCQADVDPREVDRTCEVRFQEVGSKVPLMKDNCGNTCSSLRSTPMSKISHQSSHLAEVLAKGHANEILEKGGASISLHSPPKPPAANGLPFSESDCAVGHFRLKVLPSYQILANYYKYFLYQSILFILIILLMFVCSAFPKKHVSQEKSLELTSPWAGSHRWIKSWRTLWTVHVRGPAVAVVVIYSILACEALESARVRSSCGNTTVFSFKFNKWRRRVFIRPVCNIIPAERDLHSSTFWGVFFLN